MNRNLLVPLLFAITTTAGCSLAPYQQPSANITQSPQASTGAAVTANPDSTPATPPQSTESEHGSSAPLLESLYAQHREWEGTRYRLGGMSKRGIDCSALVFLVLRDLTGIELPRTTGEQALTGGAIQREQLRSGDLVFFRTGRRGRHVGIYIEDGKFFHASTSKGVTISHLNDNYWKSRYWRARRLDLDSNS